MAYDVRCTHYKTSFNANHMTPQLQLQKPRQPKADERPAKQADKRPAAAQMQGKILIYYAAGSYLKKTSRAINKNANARTSHCMQKSSSVPWQYWR